MSLPRALGYLGNHLPLVYVFKRIRQHSKDSNLPEREVADEFSRVFPDRADFQLARLTHVLSGFGLRFEIMSPEGATNVVDIIAPAEMMSCELSRLPSSRPSNA